METSGGRGHFCGVSLSVHTQVGGWWGEGDDLFTIDGEPEPSLWGTGSEDYFCGAWCYGQTFYTNYFGMPLRSKMNHDFDNYWNVYRLHLESPVAFKQSLKVEIEHGANGFDETRAGSNNDYSSVAYWYQDSPQRLGGELPPASQRIPHYNPPAGVPGVYEFQYMQRKDVADVQADTQQMASFSKDGREWQNGDQLWLKGMKEGQSFELEFETTAPQSGPAVLRVTKAKDYGRATVALDGKQVASYDGYAKDVQPSNISLGDLQLAAGKHKLAITIKGKNSAATNTMWGGDYLRIGGQTPKAEQATGTSSTQKLAQQDESGKKPNTKPSKSKRRQQ
jgi:hypothetical protein